MPKSTRAINGGNEFYMLHSALRATYARGVKPVMVVRHPQVLTGTTWLIKIYPLLRTLHFEKFYQFQAVH
jgi:hypothetical protein